MKATLENLMKQFKKHWALVWLICALSAAGAFVVYASYTGVHSVKRVVSTRASSSILFSSNSLKSSATSQRLSSNIYTITVCNFAQDNIAEINPDPITYTINAYLAVKVGENYVKLSDYLADENVSAADKAAYTTDLSGRTYSIEMITDDGEKTDFDTAVNLVTSSNYSASITKYCALRGGVSSTDSFKIVLDDEELEGTEPEFYIYVEADPSSPATLSTIYNRLCAAKSTADAASWTGTLVESECSTVDYDFYNYVLTGSGVGTVDVLWNPDMFEINDFFFSSMSGNEFVLYDSNGEVTENTSTGSKTKDVTGDAEHNNWKMATLKVDSTEINRYQIQLYKVDGATAYTGDNCAANFITCVYHRNGSSS